MSVGVNEIVMTDSNVTDDEDAMEDEMVQGHEEDGSEIEAMEGNVEGSDVVDVATVVDNDADAVVVVAGVA